MDNGPARNRLYTDFCTLISHIVNLLLKKKAFVLLVCIHDY